MKNASVAVLLLCLVCAFAAVPASADSAYSSGPGNYTSNAWTINYGYSVSDEFTLSTAAAVTGVTFDVWTAPGDTMTSIDWSIGPSAYSAPFATAGTTQTLDELSNPTGYTIDTESFSVPSLSLGAGTYFLTLQNAVVANGDPIFWDENDGSSIGYESAVGSIGALDCSEIGNCGLSGGETFTLVGNLDPVPEPSSFLLLGSGLFGMAGGLYRKIRASRSSGFTMDVPRADNN